MRIWELAVSFKTVFPETQSYATGANVTVNPVFSQALSGLFTGHKKTGQNGVVHLEI